jgi:hypothetical protein
LPQETKSTRQCGLDWFAFFLADIQTGWGPFLAAYLTSKNWTQLDIGLILTGGTLATMALQIPIGAGRSRPLETTACRSRRGGNQRRALLPALQERRPQPSVAKYKLHRNPGEWGRP